VFKQKRTIKDKRKHKRIDLYQEAMIEVKDSNDIKSFYDCYINNISLGGISFDVEVYNVYVFEKNKIYLIFSIDGCERMDEVHIESSFKAIRNWRCGCSFVKEDKERDKQIKNYIKQCFLE